MRKFLTFVLALLCVVYVTGFFFLVPVRLHICQGKVGENIWMPMCDPILILEDTLYANIINSLDTDNLIRKVWVDNTKFWCEYDDQCEVVENKDIETTEKSK